MFSYIYTYTMYTYLFIYQVRMSKSKAVLPLIRKHLLEATNDPFQDSIRETLDEYTLQMDEKEVRAGVGVCACMYTYVTDHVFSVHDTHCGLFTYSFDMHVF